MNASQKTMAWLLSQGYNAIHQPLSAIELCAFQLPDDITHYDGLCATSRAAFLAFSHNNTIQKNFDQKLAYIQKLPLFCVGKTTAQAAQKAGFTNKITIGINAQDLIKKIMLTNYNHLLYIAGKKRLSILEESLHSSGHTINCIETYDRRAMLPSQDTTDKLPIFKAVLLYSTIGLNGLKKLHKHFDNDTKFLCLSQRIAQALPQEYQAKALITSEPTEESLFKLL